MTTLNFDATTVAPSTGGADPVPAGWYNVFMDESLMKPTKDGTGAYLQMRFSILDGQYKGRKIYARLNVRNANPETQRIAYEQLSAICHAVNVLHVQDSQMLHNIPLKVKVKLKPAEGEYEATNDITSYKNINESVGMAEQPGAQAFPTAMAAPQGFQQPAQSFQQPVQQFQPPQQQFQPPQQQAPQQAPVQPWQQPAPQAQAPVQTAPVAQQQPATQHQQPVQQPAWAQKPQEQHSQAPVQQQPANVAPPVSQEAVAGAQTAAPPWAGQAGAQVGNPPPWAQQPQK